MRRAFATAAATTVLAVHPVASADYIGITWEIDPFALDGVTLLTDLPGYDGQQVHNIYAQFDDPLDQGLGVVGTPTHPFSVFNQGTTAGFFNIPCACDPNLLPPSMFLVSIMPGLNWDSFLTVGAKYSDEFSAQVIFTPGLMGPPGQGKWGAGAIGMNMGWFLPPTNELGEPPPETQAGADGRVLFMRLTTMNPAHVIEGSFGVLVVEDGVISEVPGAFKTALVPAPGGLALVVLAGLGWRRRRPLSR
jgi:hypothetical protein